eukprot:5793486-Lingulodinium_polyedra.AAC.1
MKIPWSESGSAGPSEGAAFTVLQQYRGFFDDLRSTAISVCYVSTVTQEHWEIGGRSWFGAVRAGVIRTAKE